MEKLRECPFCGGEAILDREDVFCDNCHTSMKIYDRLYNGEAETYEEAREQAIEAWNTRASEAEIKTSVVDEFAERLKKASIKGTFQYKPDKEKPWYKECVHCRVVGTRKIDEIASQMKESE